jgi:hypothetical protein
MWLAAPAALGAAAPRARRAATAAADAAGSRATGLAHASLSRRAASAARAPLAARAGAFTASAACAGDGAAGGNGGNGSSEHSPPSRDAGPEAGGPLGDDFWRDGGGFPHYLQSRVRPSRGRHSVQRSASFVLGPPGADTRASAARLAAPSPQKSTESEPCDCTNPVGFEPPADWTCAPTFFTPHCERLRNQLTYLHSSRPAARLRRATMTRCGRPSARRRRLTPTRSRC